jgi:hypothetical protein
VDARAVASQSIATVGEANIYFGICGAERRRETCPFQEEAAECDPSMTCDLAVHDSMSTIRQAAQSRFTEWHIPTLRNVPCSSQRDIIMSNSVASRSAMGTAMELCLRAEDVVTG